MRKPNMKSRTLWLAVASLGLLAVVSFIGSVKFYAKERQKLYTQEQQKPINLGVLSVTGDEKQSGPENIDPKTLNIDPKTLKIMQRQEALEPAAKALTEAAMKSPNSGFTSLAFEGDGLRLYWKGQLDNDMLAAISKAREVGPVEIVPAAFSLAELEAEAAKIHKHINENDGSEIQSVGMRVDGSGLDIQRMPGQAAEKVSMAKVKAGKKHLRSAEQVLAGSDLRVPISLTTASEVIKPMADTRRNDSPPWKGGNRWFTYRAGRALFACTTGFGIRAYNRTWVLTAAHCATPPDVARQGDDRQYMGPVTGERRNYDLILINAPGGGRVYEGSPSSNFTRPVYGWGYNIPGQLLCQSGATTGTVCGIRTKGSTDVYFYDDQGRLLKILGLIVAARDDGRRVVNPGDSGGPVYFRLSSGGVLAKGTTSAANADSHGNFLGTVMYFQDWANVIRQYGGLPVISRTAPMALAATN